ncbi:ATP-dependent DNA helicase RecG [Pasteuria penetrans]|uniref:ATP-dependent DNA helicase RecG n=1 Tax=Pasteuria penetrans TaxID=86005 RepID=UPI000FAD9A0B|nr:ATP-dependent DNA helicase RecG [Pasteuria penetrans]
MLTTGLPLSPLSTFTILKPSEFKRLSTLGLETVADLLLYCPLRYEDHRPRTSCQFRDGEVVAIRGKVGGTSSLRWFARRRCRLSVKIQVDPPPGADGGADEMAEHVVEAVWFNQPYWGRKFSKGRSIQVIGRWNAERSQVTVQQTVLDCKEGTGDHLLPIYSSTQGLPSASIEKLVRAVWERHQGEVQELLPQALREKYSLLPRGQSISQLHHPSTSQEARHARRRLAYEELLIHQLCLAARRAQRRKQPGIARVWDEGLLKSFFSVLPWSLTPGQEEAVSVILEDLRSPHPMHRLLQGDVGTGKTVVAAFALYANVLSGYQGACMVPTEILACQHYNALTQWMVPLGVRLVLLTSRMSARAKREALGRLADGSADVVVGTHALIQDHVEFTKLGLVVTDEQHRFGVNQRAALYAKGTYPDMLCMTATPIPRTLTVTAFGEQDISLLRERPKGRKPVDTYWVRSAKWPQLVKHLRVVCERGEQAYVVCPRIEAMHEEDVNHAEQRYQKLKKQLVPHRVGLLHSRLDPLQKEEEMQAFVSGDVQVMVATTVIEVGVDVPNATMMIIEAADCFGLAQLHQLRGRVGRGERSSVCVLVADPSTEQGVERMGILKSTQDGFVIAEKDLELRGPGEFLGVRQSGLPRFHFADLQRDKRMLEMAREDAIGLLPELEQNKEWALVAEIVRGERERVRSV